MKTLFKNNWNIGILAFSLLFLASCGDDTTGGTNVIKPSVDAYAAITDVSSGSSFAVEIDVLKGDYDLNTFTIKVDGVNLATASYDILEESTENNPMLLLGNNINGFSYNINITAPTDAALYTYTFEVADAEGNVSTDAIDITVSAPSVPPTLVDNSGYEGATVSQTANQFFTIELTGTMGGSDAISTVSFMVDDVLLDASKVSYDDDAGTFTAATENPVTVMAGDQAGFTRKYHIEAHDPGSVKTYKIVLTSASGLTDEIAFDISSGTPLTVDASTVLVYNNGGPNVGGLNLYSGTAVSTASGDDHQVQDSGIDGNGNWLKQLKSKSGENVTFRSLGTMPEGWSFSWVTSQEEIAAAWVAGTDLGSETSTLSMDDVIVAAHNGNYFLIHLESVNETAANNEDYYELSVKG